MDRDELWLTVVRNPREHSELWALPQLFVGVSVW
jgi:hypothetical protein